MRALHLIQHHHAEGPGHIAHWAAKRGIAMQIWRADLGQLPSLSQLAAAHGLILLGGPASLLTPPAWLLAQQRWLAQVLSACNELAVLGICLGAQQLAQALGATIVRLAQPEIGWCALRFGEKTQQFLQWHEDGFELPPEAECFASSAACPVQGFSRSRTMARTIGLQFHPEWDQATLTLMARAMSLPAPLAQLLDASTDASHQHFVAAHSWLEHCLDGLFTPSTAVS